MADDQANSGKIVESVQVRRVPRFNQSGGGKTFVYHVEITTTQGNSGTFEVPAAVYEDDETYTVWLQEATYQLDKNQQMIG